MKSDVLICDPNGVQNFIWLVIAPPLVVSQMNQSRVVQNSQYVGNCLFESYTRELTAVPRNR